MLTAATKVTWERLSSVARRFEEEAIASIQGINMERLHSGSNQEG